uniref:Uncharacterized protein n=1 Tax=Molossus molossus TaxID=27622 RepID=A0A7J8EEB8_MOLMO|nr:hypothetical protein HJG59_008876 [Molossus molossus]
MSASPCTGEDSVHSVPDRIPGKKPLLLLGEDRFPDLSTLRVQQVWESPSCLCLLRSHHQPRVPKWKKHPETDAWSPVPSPEWAPRGLGSLMGLDSEALQTALLCEHCPSTLASASPRVTYYLPHRSCHPHARLHADETIHEPFLGPSTQGCGCYQCLQPWATSPKMCLLPLPRPLVVLSLSVCSFPGLADLNTHTHTHTHTRPCPCPPQGSTEGLWEGSCLYIPSTAPRV